MYSSVTIAVFLTSLSYASAQILTIHNECDIPAIYWHVTPEGSGDPIEIPAQSGISEPISGSGVADKIYIDDGSVDGSTELDVQYSVTGNTIWYLSLKPADVWQLSRTSCS